MRIVKMEKRTSMSKRMTMTNVIRCTSPVNTKMRSTFRWAIVAFTVFTRLCVLDCFSLSPSPSKSSFETRAKSLQDVSLVALQAVPSPVVGVEVDWQSITQRIAGEAKELTSCLLLAVDPLFKSDDACSAQDIVMICDELDQLTDSEGDEFAVTRALQVRRRALEFKRYEVLTKIMRQDYNTYTATASFLSPSRIPRDQLPNVQDVPYGPDVSLPNGPIRGKTLTDEQGAPLVEDCSLENMEFQESLLDKLILSIFRKLVVKNTGGLTSDKPGILGLLDQGRTFMIQPGQTPEAQHKMVYDTLADLMTPVLPPFYRIFMSGIVPKELGTPWDGKQLGPWFYAPWLTSVVTPTFFGFLVGPSRPNRRKDGQLGGLLVEKCKYLQESGCKGLCLHQCKIPAQQFFKEELGLPLTVSPNFVTQECQWSFGEVPLPAAMDPSFPKGCLVGCESRKAVAGTKADLCNE